ncbi:MAG: septal ring lytic transglycosylase RlpA family protein [Macromonas sp.]
MHFSQILPKFKPLVLLCGAWIALVGAPTVQATSGYEHVQGHVKQRATAAVLQQGKASFLANRFHGRPTASGERYDMHALTAAHKTLPFGTEVLVRSLETGREVVVRIVDRGPHLKSRIIDLSHAAAGALGIHGHGVSEVQLLSKKP